MKAPRLTRSGTFEERRLLRAARSDGPDASLRNRVMLSVGVGTALAASTSTTMAAPAITHAGSALAKWLGIAGVVVVGSVTPVISGDSHQLAAAVSHVTVRMPHADAMQLAVTRADGLGARETVRAESVKALGSAQGLPPATVDSLELVPRAQHNSPSAAHRSARGVGHSELSSARLDVSEEVRLVDAARSAMRAGNAPHCLELLAERQRRFPEGVLVPEAAMLRVLALRQAGQIAAAQREGQRFLLAYSSGPLATKVRSVLSAIESENHEQDDVN